MNNSQHIIDVYQDEEVSVFFREGNASDLMCTFSDLMSPVRGKRFFADVPTEKLGWPCLGFVASKPNWFPAQSMHRAIAAADTILKSFPRRTCYGASMGGYAALKYSKLIGASTTVALCPQWTLDQTKNSLFSIGWQNHFSSEMVGMEISSNDVEGNAFLLSDMQYRVDRWHTEQIQRIHPRAQVINVPGVRHHVTPALAGTRRFEEIISAAREENISKVRRVSAECRKSSPVRISDIFERASERHFKGLSSIRLDEEFDLRALTQPAKSVIIGQGLKYLALSGREKEIYRFAQKIEPNDPSLSYWAAVLSGVAHVQNKRIAMQTHHGTIMSSCPIAGIVQRSDSESSIFPLGIAISGDEASLRLEAAGAQIQINLEFNFEVIHHGFGSFSLKSPSGFLSARKDGKVTRDSKQVGAWETFKLIIFNG